MRLGKRLADAGYDNVLVLSRMKSEISAQTHRVEGLRKAADESGVLMIAIDVKDNDVDWIERKLSIALGHLSGRTAIVSLMGRCCSMCWRCCAPWASVSRMASVWSV